MSHLQLRHKKYAPNRRPILNKTWDLPPSPVATFGRDL